MQKVSDVTSGLSVTYTSSGVQKNQIKKIYRTAQSIESMETPVIY
jgi:hypothetical protein